jgi:hypothetical protein
MKKIIAVTITAILVFAVFQKCKAQKNTSSSLPAGAIATTNSGYSMIAKINGKDCKASFMMPADETGQIVGFYSGDKYIGLPYDRGYFTAGKKISFSDHHADLTTNDEVQVWSGRKGEMVITKVTGEWAEGTFYFTGYSYDNKKSITVTNGFFRIAFVKQN